MFSKLFILTRDSVSIFLISNVKKVLALLEKLDSYISGYDSNDEVFRIANMNLQKVSFSKNSDSKAVEHCASVIFLVSKSGPSCEHGWSQGRRKNVPKLCNNCSHDEYSSSSGIIRTPMKLSCPTSTSLAHQLEIL